MIVVGGMVFDGGDVDVGGLHLGSCGGLGGGLFCGSISHPVPSPPIPPTSSSVHGSGAGAASWFQPSSCPCLPGLLPPPTRLSVLFRRDLQRPAAGLAVHFQRARMPLPRRSAVHVAAFGSWLPLKAADWAATRHDTRTNLKVARV